MAAQERSGAAGDRTVLVAALILFGGVTGAVFGRVFLGTQPAFRLAAAGMLAALIATLMARRPLALSLLASAAGLLVALGILVYPDTTWLGIPTPDTFKAMVNSFRVVTEQAATEVAPAPPLDSLMTAAMMAVWSASTASHALAIRSGSSVLPLLPGAALLAFSGVVTEDPPRPGYVLLFLASAIAVLFAEAVQRTSSWGSGSPKFRTVYSGRWARVIGITAALVAIAVPGVLPGFASEGLLKIDGDTGGPVDVNPIVDIRPSLLQNPPADLFRVRSARPAYWRLVTLDHFDGTTWTLPDTSPIAGQPLVVGSQQLIGPVPPGGLLLEQDVEIEQLGAPWLPAAADPVQVTLEDDLGARHEDVNGVIELDSDTSEGMHYSVTSAVARPPLIALEEILPQNPGSDPRYTQLPPNLPQRVRDIALELTADAQTPFAEVLAIQEHLRTFTYDDKVQAGHGTDAIINFLDGSRRGYCEQFAGTMAVLVRSLGYPARVAIGFLPGDRDKEGWHRVTTSQVHAWPEVYFGQYGWLAFEPTPSRDNPTANYLVHLPSAPHPDANLGSRRNRPDEATGLLQTKDEFQGLPTIVEPVPVAREQAPAPRPFPWRRLLLGAILLAAAAFLIASPAKAIGRRLVLKRSREGRQRVRAAYGWMLDGAADLGLARQPGETVEEYRERLSGRAVSDQALERITHLAGRALYSAGRMPRQEGEEAVAAAKAIVRDLRKEAGPLKTLAAAIRPGRPPD